MRNLASLIIILLTPLLGNTLYGQQYHKVLQPDGGYIIQLGRAQSFEDQTDNFDDKSPASSSKTNQDIPSPITTQYEDHFFKSTDLTTKLIPPSLTSKGLNLNPPSISGYSFPSKSGPQVSSRTTAENDIIFSEISTVFPGVRNSNAEWGDFDNDGDLDFIISGTMDYRSRSYGTHLYENQGNDQFLLREDQDLHVIFQGTWSWTDYDGDGDLDLFGSGLNGEGAAFDKQNFLYENKKGNFVDTGLRFNPLSNSVSKWEDMDNDGDLDLVFSGTEFNTAAAARTIIYVNDGNGQFTEMIFPEISGVEFGELLLEDFDNDHDKDILLIGRPSFLKDIGLYENLGNLEFSFVFKSQISDPKFSTADAGDIDQDGDLDIVIGGRTDTKIFENRGHMNFQKLTISPDLPEASTGQVKLVDVNNDGWVDLFITGFENSARHTHIYLNDGNKDFIQMVDQGIIGVNSSATEFADYDNDGDLDLLLTGLGDNNEVHTKIYRNSIAQSNQKPSAPTNVVITTDFDDAVISWSAASDDITNDLSLTYNYYLSRSSGNADVGPPLSNLNTGFRKVGRGGNIGSQTSWRLKDLPLGQYFVGIQTMDGMNKASEFSSEISFTIVEKDAPNAPTGLKAISKTSTSVDLSWNDAADDESSFRIERSITGLNNDFSTIDIQPVNTEAYRDKSAGLLAETRYYYRIFAVGIDGKEAISKSVSVTTQNPQAPANFHASEVFPESIIFEWNDESTNALNFILERSNYRTFNFQSVAELSPDMTRYVDENLSSQQIYYRLGTRLPNNEVLYSSVIEVSLPNYFTFKDLGIENTSSAGAAWADFDNDGDPDLLLRSELFKNEGNGTFSIFDGISLPVSSSSDVYSAWGDFNNDGWIDLLYMGRQGLELYFNESGRSFTSFDFGTRYSAWHIIPTDLDNDGFLDILGITVGAKNLILKNVQGVFFQRITEGSLYENSEQNRTGGVADINNDDLPDIFLANQNEPDKLLINQGNMNFIENTPNILKAENQTTLIVSFGHLDNDGYIDVALAKNNRTQFFSGDGRGEFQLMQEFVRTDYLLSSITWADIDNDGDQDIISGRSLRKPTMVWINDGEGNLSPQIFGSLLEDVGWARGVSTADYDLDGDLDLMVTQYQDGHHVFYENNHTNHNNYNWLKVKLSGFRTNWSAIGTRVKIKVNNEWRFNQVPGSNKTGSDDLIVHFGLNKATEIDSLVVRWPSGNTQSLSTVQANQVINIQEADVLPPDTPSCLIANKITDNKIVLSWKDNTINEDNYILERSIDNATFTLLALLDPDQTQYEDISLSTSTTYYYRLYAENVLARSDTIYSTQIRLDLGEDLTFCSGESYLLDAGAGFNSYLWNDGSTSQIRSVSEAETYSVTVSIANGCTVSDEISIALLDAPIIDLGEDQNICEGASIELDAGDSFDSYLWNDGSTNQTLTVSQTGTYSVTVTNTNGCTSSDEISIAFDVPVIDLGEDQNICEGETYLLDAGDSFDSYLWNDGSTNQTLMVSQTGTYSVTVTNANGCTSSDEISIELLGVPAIELGEDQNICEGASIELDAGDSFDSHLWSDGSTNQTRTVSEAGTYSVTVTNTNGCTSSDEISITLLNAPIIDLGEDQNICEGASIELDAGDNFDSYLWNDGSTNQTLTVSQTGTYSVTVTNANGCTSSDEISVELLDVPVIDLGEDQNTCEGASIELDGGDNFDSYLWNDGSTNQTLTASQTGTYSVTVTNANGCTSSDEISITLLNAPIIDLGEDQNICEGASIELDAGDNFDSYLWSDGSTNHTLTVSEAGAYSVTVTNANGCTSSDEISVELLDVPVIDLGEDQNICEGASIELDAGDNFDSYLWNDGSTNQTLTISEAGIFSMTVTNADGCTSSDEISIEVLDVPVIDLGEDQSICEGASIDLDAGNGFDSYLWNDGSTNQTLMVSEAGTFSVTVTNADGCTSSDEISIELLDVPVIDLGEDQNICEGASIELDAGNGFDSYLWNDGSTNQTLTISEAGIFSVTVTNADRCTSSDEISIEVLDVQVIDLGEDQSICEGASIDLDAGNGFDSYLWNDGSTNQTLTVSEAGTFSVTVTNANGCTSSDEISIELLDVPAIDLGEDQSICEGASIDLDAGNGFDSYLWNDGSTNQTLTVSEAGTFSVTVTNANGCTSSDEISITLYDEPVVDLGDDLLITDRNSITLDAGEGFSTYTWSNGMTTQRIEVQESGIYSVIVSSADECAGTDEISVVFDLPLSVNKQNGKIGIYPNPVVDKLFLENFDNSKRFDIVITSITGKKVLHQVEYMESFIPFEMDLSGIEGGLYFIVIDGKVSNKFYKP